MKVIPKDAKVIGKIIGQIDMERKKVKEDDKYIPELKSLKLLLIDLLEKKSDINVMPSVTVKAPDVSVSSPDINIENNNKHHSKWTFEIERDGRGFIKTVIATAEEKYEEIDD